MIVGRCFRTRSWSPLNSLAVSTLFLVFACLGTFLPDINGRQEQGSAAAKSSRADSLLGEAQNNVGAGRPAAALANLSQFLDVLKNDPGLRGVDQDRVKRGLHLALSIRAREPESFAPNFLAAELLFLANRPNAALALLTPFRNVSQSDPEYLSLLGNCYVRTSQAQNALQAFKQAILLAPQRADLYFQLAGLYQAARDNQAAIEIVNKALAKGLSSPLLHFALGLSYFNLSKFDSAIDQFRKAAELQPQFAKAYYYIGRCALKLANDEAALGAFRKATSLDPEDYRNPYEISLILANRGHLREALKELAQVIRLNPKFAEARYQQGKIYSKQGRIPAAIETLQRAIALNPDLDGAYNELGQIYVRTGERDKAEEILNLLNEKKRKRKEQYERKVSGEGSSS
jgi:tetratricopeptide (TPR) repeat protein